MGLTFLIYCRWGPLHGFTAVLESEDPTREVLAPKLLERYINHEVVRLPKEVLTLDIGTNGVPIVLDNRDGKLGTLYFMNGKLFVGGKGPLPTRGLATFLSRRNICATAKENYKQDDGTGRITIVYQGTRVAPNSDLTLNRDRFFGRMTTITYSGTEQQSGYRIHLEGGQCYKVTTIGNMQAGKYAQRSFASFGKGRHRLRFYVTGLSVGTSTRIEPQMLSASSDSDQKARMAHSVDPASQAQSGDGSHLAARGFVLGGLTLSAGTKGELTTYAKVIVTVTPKSAPALSRRKGSIAYYQGRNGRQVLLKAISDDGKHVLTFDGKKVTGAHRMFRDLELVVNARGKNVVVLSFTYLQGFPVLFKAPVDSRGKVKRRDVQIWNSAGKAGIVDKGVFHPVGSVWSKSWTSVTKAALMPIDGVTAYYSRTNATLIVRSNYVNCGSSVSSH